MASREELRSVLDEELPTILTKALEWDWDEEPGVPSVADVVAGIAAEVRDQLLALLDAREDEVEALAEFDSLVNRFSAMLDATYAPDLSAEAHRWRRVAKIGEEHGEVIEAMLGAVGENPRKTGNGLDSLATSPTAVRCAGTGAAFDGSRGASPKPRTTAGGRATGSRSTMSRTRWCTPI